MPKSAILISRLITLSLTPLVYGQDAKISMSEEVKSSNPLICDPETGVCGLPGTSSGDSPPDNAVSGKPIKLVYFTDPICSSCWGIEPQLRKLKMEYGDSVEIEYRMGGLLPDWSYNSGGINKPADVARHWDEVSLHYDMPIDGDLWLEDPLSSSYPSSIAFKAAQMQDKEKALLFLCEIKEMVFLRKKNIAKWENLEAAAAKVGLNTDQLKIDSEGRARLLFEEDLKAAEHHGVRGFPSLFFSNGNGDKEDVRGSKPYAFYEMAILKLSPNAKKKEYSKNWEFLFKVHRSLTTREFSELSGMPRGESETTLDKLALEKKLKKTATKNGAVWSMDSPEG